MKIPDAVIRRSIIAPRTAGDGTGELNVEFTISAPVVEEWPIETVEAFGEGHHVNKIPIEGWKDPCRIEFRGAGAAEGHGFKISDVRFRGGSLTRKKAKKGQAVKGAELKFYARDRGALLTEWMNENRDYSGSVVVEPEQLSIDDAEES